MKDHWEKIYNKKAENEVSWYQEMPSTSIRLIRKYCKNKFSSIIDVGGGNSNLAYQLVSQGYQYVSVLDVSKTALEQNQEKLKGRMETLDFIESNILEFNKPVKYDVWHDRATSHFLICVTEIEKYAEIAASHIRPDGYLILSTFSMKGPDKCSGLEITKYNEDSINEVFKKDFKLMESFEETHNTPFDTSQQFIWAVFQRK